LGEALAFAGRTTDAIALFEQLRVSQTMRLGADHPDTLLTLNNLACVYSYAGRRGDALELWERIVPVADEKRGPAHGASLMFRLNWIWALEADRRWAKAVEQRRELVALRRRSYEANGGLMDLASDLMLLGRSLIKAGRAADADPVLRNGISLLEKEHGSDW